MANALKFDLARPRLCYRQWMLAGNPAYFFDHLARHCGDFIHYRGLFSFYFVNHPELVKQVLTGTNKTLDKHTVIYDRFREAFGDGLVVAEGEQWTRKRRLMQPMFSPSTIHGFFETLLCAAEKMVAHWETRCHEQTVFDVAHDMEQVTLRIAGEVLFSDGFDDASERIASWTSAINRYSAKPPLPILRQPWFPSRTNWQLKRTLREFHAFIGNLIEQRRQSPQSNDLLTTLLQSQQGEDGKAIGDHEIKEEILGMIIGGHETSSSALTWIWYELHRNPEAQQRLREEIELVVGKEKLTIDHLPQLSYTRMVVDEVLRLHPPFWFENRNVREDMDLGGHRIPKGSMIVFSRYSLHRHPAWWESPDTFKPSRQDPLDPENPRASYAQVPFGGGPRICIGVNLAIMELIIILTVVTRRFRVVVDESDRHEMAAQLTMAPKHGLRVRLERASGTEAL